MCQKPNIDGLDRAPFPKVGRQNVDNHGNPDVGSDMPLKSVMAGTFRRKALRLLLIGRECLARPDTGSDEIIMTEATAKRHGTTILRSEEDKSDFQVGSGK